MAEEPHGDRIAALIHSLRDLRISPRVSLSVAIIGAVFAVLTWAPDRLGIRSAIQSWRPWALLAAIGGATLFVVDLVYGASERRRSARKERRERRKAWEQREADRAANIEFLTNMTPVERATCKEFLDKNERSLVLNPTSGVLELTRRDVLRQISPAAWTYYHYSMSDWAWEHLRAHPELCDVRR